jgi:small GTP-binding protein
MSISNIKILNEPPTDFDLNFKLIVIGDSFVGKSCLTLKATKGLFEANYSPTIGFEFLTFFVNIDNTNIKLQIWDTCGQEVYRSLISSFYHNSSLAILVYSIDNENSFNNLEIWLNEIKTLGNPDMNVFLVGNKADLEDKRQVSKERAEEFCKSHQMNFFLETSAKTGLNAQNVFIEASKLLFQKHLEIKDRFSRPDSVNVTERTSERNTVNVVHLVPKGQDEEEGKRRKKKCCF